jgi:PAP2 superfamily
VVLAAKRYLKRVPWSGWGMLVLAAAGSHSRVYVGVHYPTDVLAGVGLWIACGWIEARCVVGTGSRLGDQAVRGKRAALVKRFRTVQYLDSKKTGADETGNVRGAGYVLRGA